MLIIVPICSHVQLFCEMLHVEMGAEQAATLAGRWDGTAWE